MASSRSTHKCLKNIIQGASNIFTRRQASRLSADIKARGSIVAPFTPFTSHGNVDIKKLPSYVEHLKKCDVPSIFVNGTTGEGLSMTVSERKDVTEAWLDNQQSFEHMIFHIGAGNLRDSQELAKHCASVGAEAIACISPNYFKPQKVEDLVAYMSLVAKEAPNTPFYLYDINFMTQVYLDNYRFLELAKNEIPNLVGIKHSSPELNSLVRCHKTDYESFHILLGSDDTLLPAMSMGISDSVPNSFMAPLHNKIRLAVEKGDLETARNVQLKTMEIAAIRAKYATGAGLFAASRAIVQMMGCNLGSPRLPLVELDKEKYVDLEKDLNAIGFFDSNF
ncbi:N-acetylneuraminate lyase-like [Watersipora subatra]|uniref:N-acetylneuraminate lyase-like n=1 Tax=Watersipora subatra TaxID=2589382 RepID=UPI00355C7EB8